MSTQECDWNIAAGLIREGTKQPASDLDSHMMVMALAHWAASTREKEAQSIEKHLNHNFPTQTAFYGQCQVNIVIWGEVLNSQDLHRELHF